MDAQLRSIAQECLTGSYAGTVEFLSIVGQLKAAGFDGYLVDYRRGTTTYYLASGEAATFENVKTPGVVASMFNAAVVAENVSRSQSNAHTYVQFCENVKAAGCAFYLVSLPGKRVVYFGRTGETHVEHFPG